MKKVLVVMAGAVLLAGCVSSKEYRARVGEIDNLKQNVSQLETRVRALEQKNAGLKTQLKTTQDDRMALQSGLKTAQDNKASLEKQLKSTEEDEAAVQEENALLRGQVAEIAKQRDIAMAEKEKSISSLKSTYDNLVKELNKEIQAGQIAITQLKDKLSLTMVEKVLFDSGSAEIKKDGKNVLDRLGKILKEVMDRQTNIEGHTDNVPISPRLRERFPTNWELSTARAAIVVRYLQEKVNLDPRLMNASGFAEYRPAESNDTNQGKAKNRRIEIILIPLGLEKTAQ